MNYAEQRLFLLNYLLQENTDYITISIPQTAEEQQRLLRALFNVRQPKPVSDEFLQVQDAYLQHTIAQKGITNSATIPEVLPNIHLWQGDITTLQCDAIVNAANSRLLGCWQPGHYCIDNAIHTFAGVQLRNYCYDLMQKQGIKELPGQAKITPAFNLPCNYIIHTVGPQIALLPTSKDCEVLKSCYLQCLALASAQHLTSLAFCCIATGAFAFPKALAAKLALSTVLNAHPQLQIIFTVYSTEDYELYQKTLATLQ